jgi:hypothetical protein
VLCHQLSLNQPRDKELIDDEKWNTYPNFHLYCSIINFHRFWQFCFPCLFEYFLVPSDQNIWSHNFFFIYINNIITVWFVVWCLWVYIFTQPDLIVLLTEIYVGTNTHSLSICILPSALVKWTFIYLLVYSSVNITYHQRNTNSSGIYINFISTLSKIYPVNNILKNILNKSTKIIKII